MSKNLQKIKNFKDLKDGTLVISNIDNVVTEYKAFEDGGEYLCSKRSMWHIRQFDPNDFVVYTGNKDIDEVDSSFFEKEE